MLLLGSQGLKSMKFNSMISENGYLANPLDGVGRLCVPSIGRSNCLVRLGWNLHLTCFQCHFPSKLLDIAHCCSFDIFNDNNIVCYYINKLQREKRNIRSKDVGANAKFAKNFHLLIIIKWTFHTT
jgi:hypothetical protein